jgi:hypothetical protein
MASGGLRPLAGMLGLVLEYRMSGELFAVLNIAAITFLFVVSPFVYQFRPWAMRIAGIVAIVEIVNGFYHVSATFVAGGYFPGAISGIGLVILGILYLSHRRVDL